MERIVALGKALRDLTADDLQLLITEQWGEDETLEFKQTLSHPSGKQDRWLIDQSSIGDSAKRDLFAEVVGMANSYGGDVVLGMAETEDQPPRAGKLVPIPQCVILAARLEQSARSLIKPSLPLLGVRGIELENGAGVVVIRVPRSRSAPHRLEMKGIEKECYRRVSDRTEPMTMREIQEMTLSTSRWLSGIQDRLQTVRSEFKQWLRKEDKFYGGFALAAIPLDTDLYIAQVHNNQALTPKSRHFQVSLNDRQVTDFAGLPQLGPWRPVLRGSETTIERGEGYRALRRVGCDGTLLSFDCVGAPPGKELFLFPTWIFSAVLNVFEDVDSLRQAAGAHSVEYALQFEFLSDSQLAIKRIGNGYNEGSIGEIPLGATLFPTYTIGSRQSWPETVFLMWNDFLNAIGLDSAGSMFEVKGW